MFELLFLLVAKNVIYFRDKPNKDFLFDQLSRASKTDYFFHFCLFALDAILDRLNASDVLPSVFVDINLKTNLL